MATVTCDKRKTQFALGKLKHRWIDKDNDIALKYQQCPTCKSVFPERIQTNQQLDDVRKLRGMRYKAEQLAKVDERQYEDAVTEADMFQLEILLEQEKLKAEYGQGFLKRSCPKCGLPATHIRPFKHSIGETDGRQVCRARLGCLCGWVGRYPDLKTQM